MEQEEEERDGDREGPVSEEKVKDPSQPPHFFFLFFDVNMHCSLKPE